MSKRDVESPMQYRSEEKTERIPQRPGHQGGELAAGWYWQEEGQMADVPLSSVIKSARCMARMSEKCPVSEDKRSFCFSYAATASVSNGDLSPGK